MELTSVIINGADEGFETVEVTVKTLNNTIVGEGILYYSKQYDKISIKSIQVHKVAPVVEDMVDRLFDALYSFNQKTDVWVLTEQVQKEWPEKLFHTWEQQYGVVFAREVILH